MKQIVGSILFLLYSSIVLGVPNAGMLPYAYKNGKAYFLLGLENRIWDRNKPWTKGRSTWVWTDFGGKCDPPDQTEAARYNTDQATLCAAREGTEETRYVFGNKPPLKSGLRNNSQEYDNSVRYLIKNVKNRFTVDQNYEEFFVEVDYIDAQNINNSPSVPSDEKIEWRWMLVQDVLNALQNADSNGFYRFNFQHKQTNKIFPDFASTLRRHDVQNFIQSTILAGEA